MDQDTEVKKKYSEYVKENSLSLFYQPWYLDAVCSKDNWDVVLASKDGKVLGAWPYYIKKKCGLTTITQPTLTPYLGPHIIKRKQKGKVNTQLSFEKKILTELSKQLPKVSRLIVQGHPVWSNWQPLSWLGFEQTIRYTFLIDLTKSEEELNSALSDKTRNQIKRAKESLTIIEHPSSSAILDLVKATYQRQNKKCPYSNQQFDMLHKALSDRSCFKAYVASHENEIVATVYTIFDELTTYLLITAQSDKKISGSVSFLIWHSLLDAKKRGCTTFDFEGSMIEGVESFFRSFGGNQVPYHRVTKASNRFLYILFKLFGKL